ncbi:hypothetical protein CWE22_00185 [Pseudidiomarina aestuarii]|uniref:Type II secretion system protein GspB C-terminal domain-containing protein n=1 Tax=Pseudidiomarina aestuarii TaxID=624146 RepID=A0A7Z6ZSR3_9GAMM|nr:general secretion pathway protein GspB [Pseudidiomarina aestuarii]RUO40670.1 hypothetical protein CWE22_00185 [Pseudidiomarina aestuarii]
MSSVLKALRQQSSPHIPPRSQGQLTSAPVQREGLQRVVRSLLMIVLLALAGAIGWWLAAPNQQTVSSSPTVVMEPTYDLGDATVVRVPDLEPDRPVVDTGTRIEPNRVVQEAPEQPQAVNLDTVSPELLSAFEEAIAATGSEAGEAASVVPALLTLSRSFQQQIPSFTYDGHQYSSRSNSRWIELSGQRLQEGDRWQALSVIRIAPAHVVLAKDNQAFLQPALEDWTKP